MLTQKSATEIDPPSSTRDFRIANQTSGLTIRYAILFLISLTLNHLDCLSNIGLDVNCLLKSANLTAALGS